MRIALSYQSEKATVVTCQRRKAQISIHCTPLSRKDTKVWVSMASRYPWQNLYQQVWMNLRC
jgi:hypothetical protein